MGLPLRAEIILNPNNRIQSTLPISNLSSSILISTSPIRNHQPIPPLSSHSVRIRPFSPSETLKLAPTDVPAPFLGDGGLGVSPIKQDQPRRAGGGGGYLKSILNAVDDKVLIFDPPTSNPLQRMYTGGSGAKKARDVRYAFDRVLGPETRQEEVFEETTKKLLDGVMKGWNASVFAYGVSNSSWEEGSEVERVGKSREVGVLLSKASP